MASTSITGIREEISQKGFWVHNDAGIGKLVDSIVKNNYLTQNEEGMDLCRAAVFKNPYVSEVAKSFFPRSTLGFYRFFGKTSKKHCILNYSADMRMLVVFCWSSSSVGTIYARSHTHNLKAMKHGNGLLEIPDTALDLPGIVPHPVELIHGGLAIVDARSGWQIDTGKSGLLGVMIPEELPFWAPMPFPSTLNDTVDDMISETLDMNVKFFEVEIQEK